MFECDVLSHPPHIIKWTFINSSGVETQINDSSKYSIVSNRSTTRFGELTVMNVVYEDRGKYICAALNQIGSDMKFANLTVQGE